MSSTRRKAEATLAVGGKTTERILAEIFFEHFMCVALVDTCNMTNNGMVFINAFWQIERVGNLDT